jgi:putative transcriptional regulator
MPYHGGSFLVARPVLQDPNFRQAVVLLLQHGAEGAFGLVVNRPAPVKGAPFPVFAGGPCPAQGLLMLHGHDEWLNLTPELEGKGIAPGIFLGNAECLKRANDAEASDPLRYRVFSGYAGWGPGQLESELAAGAWTIVPANGALLFDTPVEELWDKLAPPRLPQFSLN